MQTYPTGFKNEVSRFAAALGWRALPVHLALLAAFGIFLPWWRGIEFLDPVMLAAYACFGVVFSAPAAAQLFAVAPNFFSEVVARIVVAVAYGEIMAFGMLLAAMATVYLTHPLPVPPDLGGLAAASGLGLAASFSLTAIAAWIAIQFGPGAARAATRLIFLGLLVLFFFRSRSLADIAAVAALFTLAPGAIAIIAIKRRVG